MLLNSEFFLHQLAFICRLAIYSVAIFILLFFGFIGLWLLAEKVIGSRRAYNIFGLVLIGTAGAGLFLLELVKILSGFIILGGLIYFCFNY